MSVSIERIIHRIDRRMLYVTIIDVTEDYEGKVKIAKFYVSVDDAIDRKNKIAVEYDLMGFPTFYLKMAKYNFPCKVL